MKYGFRFAHTAEQSCLTTRLLRRGNPPFRLVTQPSVLKRYALPGIVQTEYEKARVTLDPGLRVIEQSAGEVYAPYWMAAAGGAIAGISLLAGSVIIAASARRMARVSLETGRG